MQYQMSERHACPWSPTLAKTRKERGTRLFPEKRVEHDPQLFNERFCEQPAQKCQEEKSFPAETRPLRILNGDEIATSEANVYEKTHRRAQERTDYKERNHPGDELIFWF